MLHEPSQVLFESHVLLVLRYQEGKYTAFQDRVNVKVPRESPSQKCDDCEEDVEACNADSWVLADHFELLAGVADAGKKSVRLGVALFERVGEEIPHVGVLGWRVDKDGVDKHAPVKQERSYRQDIEHVGVRAMGCSLGGMLAS